MPPTFSSAVKPMSLSLHVPTQLWETQRREELGTATFAVGHAVAAGESFAMWSRALPVLIIAYGES